MFLSLAFLCLLPLGVFTLPSELAPRDESKGFHIGAIDITSFSTNSSILFGLIDNLIYQDPPGTHPIPSCSFAMPEVKNVQKKSGAKPILNVTSWPSGDHLPCNQPSYTVSFVDLGQNFQLILYHNILYNNSGNSSTLRVGVTNLPPVNTWSETQAGQLETVVDIVNVEERPGINTMPTESYSAISKPGS